MDDLLLPDSFGNCKLFVQERMIQAQSRLIDIFQDYANPRNKDRLTLEGVVCFFDLLQVDVEKDIIVLYIAYLMGCKSMYIITRENVKYLASTYKITTFADLGSILPNFRSELQQPSILKSVFQFAFMYTVRSQQDFIRKRLYTSTTIELLTLFYSSTIHSPSLLPSYCMFLRQHREEERGVNQDEWNMTFLFFEQFPTNDLTLFNPTGCWPMLFCEFVASISSSNT